MKRCLIVRVGSLGLLAMVSGSSDAAERLYRFDTLAGGAIFGSADGTGSAARFAHPNGVALDTAGNLYIADSANNTIRKITPGGTVTTLAGLAVSKGSTDGTGSAARFSTPGGVAVDAAGNVYVTDNSTTIRKITPGGTVTTLAGLAGSKGSTDGTGSAARFNSPAGIAVDTAGIIYVADSENFTVRKITPGGAVTTLAGVAGSRGSADGVTAARFNSPEGLAVDTAGNVYVTDSATTIRKVTPGGAVTTLAGLAGSSGSADGTGSAARFNVPAGLAVDTAGTVYVADDSNSTIRTITQGGTVTTLAGLAGNSGSTDGTGSAARFNDPIGVAVDTAGNLYVTDFANNTIRKIVAGGVVSTFAGLAGGAGSSDGIGSAARFNAPKGVAVDTAGNVYVADTSNNTIRTITPDGRVSTLAGLAGTSGATDGTGSAARLSAPTGVALDTAGNVYVADSTNFTIRKITPGGAVTTLAGLAGTSGSTDGIGSGALFKSPRDVAVDTAGTVYVADSLNYTIRAITPDGIVATLAGLAGNSGNADGTGNAARFLLPTGVAVDAAGTVYVADAGALRKITAGGAVSTITPAGEFLVQGLAVDAAGNVYGAAYNGITRVTPGGTVITFATGGTGSRDGTGTGAQFNSPQGVAVDAAGILYVADTGNHTIRKGIITQPTLGDYDADGKADLAVFRSGTWFNLQSGTGFMAGTSTSFGLNGDVPVLGDYDGDGKTDLAVWRSSIGTWFVLTSASGFSASTTELWGLPGDIPVPGDYNGDGRTDPAVFRPSTGVWYISPSSTAHPDGVTFALGLSTDIPVPADYDGDGATDIAVYRPSTGMWYIRQSSTASASSLSMSSVALQWGLPGDIPVPGDYDGDGKADVAVWRPSTGVWYIRKSSTNFTTFVSYQWGLPGDTTVPADYDGDGKIDLAVYRPATGTWYILQSSTSYATSVTYQWGLPGDVSTPNAPIAYAIAAASGKATVSALANLTRFSDFRGSHPVRVIGLPPGGRSGLTVFRPSTGVWWLDYGPFPLGVTGDIPVPGDYNGDGITDLAVYRPSIGEWFITGRTFRTFSVQWGLPGDVPVPGDYDGDGVTDIAVFRPSTGVWYILQSSTNFTTSVSFQWGLGGDVPVPGDYDGDGVTDLAVYRPSAGVWYIRQSSTGYATFASYQWGLPGDITVPGDYDGDGKTDIAVFRPTTGTWYIRLSTTNYATSLVLQFGLGGDIPVPGDFDGDGKTDVAVWRPSTGMWSVLQSSTSFTTSTAQPWGISGDIPILQRQ